MQGQGAKRLEAKQDKKNGLQQVFNQPNVPDNVLMMLFFKAVTRSQNYVSQKGKVKLKMGLY
ncbi:Hypothetical predicted protein, partial [Paramuricea clavata]